MSVAGFSLGQEMNAIYADRVKTDGFGIFPHYRTVSLESCAVAGQ